MRVVRVWEDKANGHFIDVSIIGDRRVQRSIGPCGDTTTVHRLRPAKDGSGRFYEIYMWDSARPYLTWHDDDAYERSVPGGQ